MVVAHGHGSVVTGGVWWAAEVGVLEMVIILAQRIEDEENRTWNLLLLDIFSLIFVSPRPAPCRRAASGS